MYQRAEICFPQKKRVRESYRPNTYRIFNEKVPDYLNPDQVYNDHKYASRHPDETELLKTHNVPQPHNIRFIRTNVRFLNEPVAFIETENTKAEQFKWWSNIPANNVLRKTVYSKESTQRRDYQPITPSPVNRVQNRSPAIGIVPALNPHCQPKERSECMSFNHQQDSRNLHDQFYKRKRHGAFVWSERGAIGAVAFQSTEGLRSPSEQRAHGLNSSQPMYASTETFSSQSSSQSENETAERIPSQSGRRPHCVFSSSGGVSVVENTQ